MKLPVKMTINGQSYSHEVEPRLLLVHYIREAVGLTGTHVGCDTSQCGACTVLIDGQAVKCCTLFAVQADGAHTTPIQVRRRGMMGVMSPAPVVKRGESQNPADTTENPVGPARCKEGTVTAVVEEDKNRHENPARKDGERQGQQ